MLWSGVSATQYARRRSNPILQVRLRPERQLPWLLYLQLRQPRRLVLRRRRSRCKLHGAITLRRGRQRLQVELRPDQLHVRLQAPCLYGDIHSTGHVPSDKLRPDLNARQEGGHESRRAAPERAAKRSFNDPFVHLRLPSEC